MIMPNHTLVRYLAPTEGARRHKKDVRLQKKWGRMSRVPWRLAGQSAEAGKRTVADAEIKEGFGCRTIGRWSESACSGHAPPKAMPPRSRQRDRWCSIPWSSSVSTLDRNTSNSKFDFNVRSQPRSEIAGYLAQRIFQGWRAASGRALRKIPRRFVSGKAKFRIAAEIQAP